MTDMNVSVGDSAKGIQSILNESEKCLMDMHDKRGLILLNTWLKIELSIKKHAGE